MNTPRLISAMDYIDDRFLNEALDCKKIRLARAGIKRALIAACLAVIILTPGAWGNEGTVLSTKPRLPERPPEPVNYAAFFEEIYLHDGESEPHEKYLPDISTAMMLHAVSQCILN